MAKARLKKRVGKPTTIASVVTRSASLNIRQRAIRRAPPGPEIFTFRSNTDTIFYTENVAVFVHLRSAGRSLVSVVGQLDRDVRRNIDFNTIIRKRGVRAR